MHRVIQEWFGDALIAKGYKYAKRLDLSERFHDIFMEELRPVIKQMDADGNEYYMCSRQDLDEFYEQGVAILSYLQDNAHKIFPTEDVKLYGIEVPLSVALRENLEFMGMLDIITHNTKTGEYFIYDLKTSRSGWNAKAKSDPLKKSQLLLYKKYFCEQHDIPFDMVHVEFIILKRMLFENPMFTVPRVSKFVPPSGKPSINKVTKEFERFLDACYDSSGNPIVADIKPTPSRDNCKYCPFRTNKEMCPVGVNVNREYHVVYDVEVES